MTICVVLGCTEVVIDAPVVVYERIAEESMEDLRKFLALKEGDALYVLGSGKGAIPIYMYEHTPAYKVAGIEINPAKHQKAVASMQNRIDTDDDTREIEFICGDILQEDFNEATVVFMNILPYTTEEVRTEDNIDKRLKLIEEQRLRLTNRIASQLKPGTRVVAIARLTEYANLKLEGYIQLNTQVCTARKIRCYRRI